MSPTPPPPMPTPYIPGQIIVQFAPSAIAQQVPPAPGGPAPVAPLAKLMALQHSGAITHAIPLFTPFQGTHWSVNNDVLKAVNFSFSNEAPTALRGYVLLEFTPGSELVELQNVTATPDVVFAEFVPRRYIPALVNRESTANAPRQWNLDAIHWSTADRPDASTVRIDLVDSSVDATHPALVGLVSGFDPPGGQDGDPGSHGTAVASVLTGLDATFGYYGVTSDPVNVWKVGVVMKSDSGTSTVVDTVRFLEVLGALVKEASVPGTPRRIVHLSVAETAKSKHMKHALEALAAQGCVIVAPSGDTEQQGGTTSVVYPAAYPEVIAVAASQQDGAPWSGSCCGSVVCIAAPGGDGVYAARSHANVGQTDDVPRAALYEFSDGTSLAAPQVTAAIAMLLTVNAGLTAGDIRALLSTTATPWADPDNTSSYGAGVLNLEGLLGTK